MSCRNHARRARAPLGVSVLLALGILFMASGTALGISGMAASVEPAVRAQYPDAEALRPPPEQVAEAPVVAQLADIGRELRRDPVERAEAERLQPRVMTVLSDAATLKSVEEQVREYGTLTLLLAGIAVFSVGTFLRLRRGAQPPVLP